MYLQAKGQFSKQAHVAVPEAVHHRRMNIPLRVRMLVMNAVVNDPPERPLLQRRAARQRQQKLKRPRGAEGVVRKVAVEPDGHAEPRDAALLEGDDRFLEVTAQ